MKIGGNDASNPLVSIPHQPILHTLGVKTRLLSICLRRILEFFGHIARKDGHNLEQLMNADNHLVLIIL
ncbi:unnamed protein product [Leptidea sinapis]|uniref:Uncharacterized protein n=1 Tax=Leptidea sinapis TaxID=189913 RepID=A0A5E4R2T8_9NEOP|nr:unnamed protein product [Leptidea sinapis]